MNVEPITVQERMHCAYCAKPLQPAYACRKMFYSGTIEAKGRSPEEQLAEYRTNQRIVRIGRTYHTVRDYETGAVKSREVSRIEIVHFPEPDQWGLWGKFCGQQCAARFGYAAHQAGYRPGRKP